MNKLSVQQIFQGFFVLIATALLTACAPQGISTLVGGDYDADQNATEYFVMPYGKTALPGKWEKGEYNQVSRQQFFHNQDSIEVAVAFGRYDYYEFNKDGSLKGFDFLQDFYDWDSKYFEDQGLNRQLLEENRDNNYIIYRIYGPKVNTYFLIAEKNGNIGNFSVNSTEKWTETEKLAFLKALSREFHK